VGEESDSSLLNVQRDVLGNLIVSNGIEGCKQAVASNRSLWERRNLISVFFFISLRAAQEKGTFLVGRSTKENLISLENK